MKRQEKYPILKDLTAFKKVGNKCHQSEGGSDKVHEFILGKRKLYLTEPTESSNRENEEIEICVPYDNETQSSRIKNELQISQMS